MAISDFYASTIISVNVSFCLPYDPDEVSRVLGMKADSQMRKGEMVVLPGGKLFQRPLSNWSIRSQSRSKDVNEHLRELLLRLEGVGHLIDTAWGAPFFSVTWKGNYLYAGSGPFYQADVLAGIAALNAELYQDIYQIDQDDDEIDNPSHFKRLPN